MVRSICSVRSSTRRDAEAASCRFILLGCVLDRVALVIGAEPGELGAADDLEENRLVLTGA